MIVAESVTYLDHGRELIFKSPIYYKFRPLTANYFPHIRNYGFNLSRLLFSDPWLSCPSITSLPLGIVSCGFYSVGYGFPSSHDLRSL